MFDQAKADQVCERVYDGLPIITACREVGVPRQTLYDWEAKNQPFAVQLARARSANCDALVDQCLEIADDETHDWALSKKGVICDEVAIGRARLRVDTRLKLVAKLDPKRYGDRIQSDVDLNVKVTLVNPFQIAQDAASAALAPVAMLDKPDNG
jgi:hypothetical protein